MKRSRESENEPIRLLDVEFVGGPYDGHQETYHTCARRLPQDVVWLVGADAFRMLDGEGHQLKIDPRRSLTSVALYSREPAGESFRYRFVGVISVKRLTESINSNQES